MEQKTLEGTWEEVSRHGHELIGRKVRITILEDPAPPLSLDKALAHLIRDAEALVGSLPSSEPSHSVDTWSEGVEAKYRRQGFTI
jgi:hypothetical protein